MSIPKPRGRYGKGHGGGNRHGVHNVFAGLLKVRARLRIVWMALHVIAFAVRMALYVIDLDVITVSRQDARNFE